MATCETNARKTMVRMVRKRKHWGGGEEENMDEDEIVSEETEEPSLISTSVVGMWLTVPVFLWVCSYVKQWMAIRIEWTDFT